MTDSTDLEVMQTNVEADEFLAHFGVKGMKWGKHTAGSDSGGGSSRSEAKASKAQAKVDKIVTKQKAEAARDKTILDARKNIDKTGAQLKVAKAQYKVDKHAVGKAAAKEALNKVRDKHLDNVYNANLSTGKELVQARNDAFWTALDQASKKLSES